MARKRVDGHKREVLPMVDELIDKCMQMSDDAAELEYFDHKKCVANMLRISIEMRRVVLPEFEKKLRAIRLSMVKDNK